MYRIIGVVLFLAGGVAFAQDSDTSVTVGGLDADLQHAADATPGEMGSMAEHAVVRVKELIKDVKKMTADAQNKSDADLLECLVPKATSIEALGKVTQTSSASMNAAIDNWNDQNEKVARYHFRLIVVALDRAEAIRQAAEGCDSRDSFSGDKQQIKWVGGVGDDDDTVDRDQLNDIDVGIDPPQPVSGFTP